MPKEDNKGVIRIESILGGQSLLSHFAAHDQFRAALGIDPSQPINDSTQAKSIVSSGLLRPNGTVELSSGSDLVHAPMWMESNPKNGNVYVYDYAGSVYTIDGNFTAVTGLGDLNDGMSAKGNGCAYYDNYMYFSTDTTVARYGPLDGTAAFTDDYWVTTLSKTRLTDNSGYPSQNRISTITFPTHVLHRHSDGKLYIADVVDGKGTIHYIATTKTTVEGDTDNGSTYNKVQVGYGLLPTAMESYGSDLVIAFYEGNASGFVTQSRAKVAFWDTTSTNVNKIVWVEFPDDYISAMKNIDGILYVASGRVKADGFRVSRFVGGYTFEEVAFFGTGAMPFPDAMDGQSNQLLFGSYTDVPETAGCVYSLGLNNSKLGQGIFTPHRVTYTAAISCVTSLYLSDNWNLGFLAPTVGWTTGASGVSTNGIDVRVASGYDNAPPVFWSQMYRIGQPFKITKIRIPLAQAVAANHILIPKIYTDDGNGTTYTLTTINNTNYPNSERNITYRLENVTGQHNFWLELRWTGSAFMTVGLPITIEYELTDD